MQWQPPVATNWNWKLRLKALQNAEAESSNRCHGDEVEIPQTFSAPAHKTWRTVTEAFFLRSLGTFELISENVEPEEKRVISKKGDRMIQPHVFRQAWSGTERCMHLYGMTSKMFSLYVMSSYPCKKLQQKHFFNTIVLLDNRILANGNSIYFLVWNTEEILLFQLSQCFIILKTLSKTSVFISLLV